MCHESDETYAIYDETDIKKSRKPHLCHACREIIPPASPYTRIFMLFDGRKSNLNRCWRCQKIHKHLRWKDGSDLWPDEYLGCGISYKDAWGIDPPEELASLAFAPISGPIQCV